MDDTTNLNILKEHVLHVAAEHHLWSSHDIIVVAVSGGADSVALLHILYNISKTHTPLKLICAHVHHGFRKESDAEVELVRSLAEQMDIPFELTYANIPAYMEESGKGAQEASRDKRYDFLLQVASNYGARSIALAHHADDQAETVMMRLLRGSGPSGLTGMKYKRFEGNVELIRPFLRIYKTDLLQVCHQSGYPYATDNTNFQNKYTRNAIRLDVLPFLGQYNGQIAQSLNHLAEIMASEDEYMEQAAENAYHKLVQRSDGRLAFKVPSFLGLHAALQRRMIKLILNYLSAGSENTDFDTIEMVRRRIVQHDSTTWSLDLGGGLACIREYDMITVMPKQTDQTICYTYRLDAAVLELRMNEIGKVLRMTEQSPEEEYWEDTVEAGQQAVFDANELEFPLTLRPRLPGDTMKVMGLNGSKKVKDIFIDAKIPPSLRSRIPIVVDGSGNIVWIPGLRRSVHAKIDDHTLTVLHMAFFNDGSFG
ncbi:tRNA lysidine(34) synthetase TilS [Paenibacillus pini]|uniref:tRNA(Ile)-lysidine synthase n=1 Tax=Paenibacillus pini JCM 16418 TaxID=1236976 RepID=W7Z0U3_9BACL|nr:tRNA lysidine(34) synthetase TilS [Paenibacillus pini]GAF10576.1 tRNA(Ile)-lysidine synthetase [Paenibacillus pini JCM 16418]